MSRDILIINNNLDTGGVEKILQALAAYLHDKGARISIWASKGDRATIKEKYPPSVRFRRYPFWNLEAARFTPKWFYSRISRVLFEKFLLRLKKWDVVVAFKEGEDMILASKLRARRKVAWVHTDYANFHWTPYLFESDEAERLCMAGFDAVAAVSDAAAKGLRAAIGDPGNVSTVYNPINPYAIEEKAGLEKLARPVDKALLVTVGRLSEVKRFDMLIDICHELSTEFPLELWIIGGGELERELREKLERENIDCVRMFGMKSNPYPYIACADWLISSSASESYALTVQEALILGVPVIASYCPAIQETLPESCGIITAADKESLKAGIAAALSEEQKAAELRKNISSCYDKSSIWEDRLETMYRFITG